METAMVAEHPESGAEQAEGKLPPDCVFLPIADGELLVSRNHAVFCRVPADELEAAHVVVSGDRGMEVLSQKLIDDLDRHGFFGSPRQPEPDPPTVQLQLTNACNLACRYCCTNSGKPRDGEVTYEDLLDAVRQIPRTLGSGTQVAILGGEPLVVPWALDLASNILALDLGLTIFTNGIPLADESLAERTAALVKLGAKVRVSLGGPSVSTCDAVSGADRFDAAIQGINRLASFGGHATADLMLIPEHVDTIAEELPRLRERLPSDTPIAFGVLYVSGRETGQHLFRNRTDLENALDRISLEAGEAIPASKTSPVAHRREGCVCALGGHIHVRSDGALFSCFKMEEKAGDLRTTGFAAAAKFIRENPHRSVDLPKCTACPLATLCGAGCRSENLLYTGDPDEPPCGEWRVRVLSELLAEDKTMAVEWSVAFLLEEARVRGIDTPDNLAPKVTSRHLVDV